MKLTGVLLAVVIGLFVVVLAQGYAGRLELHRSQLRGCERGKLDRADNAASWTAHRKYLEKVTAAASVKEDVKAAAREANRTYRETSKRLTERSHLNCAKAFPAPAVLPRF